MIKHHIRIYNRFVEEGEPGYSEKDFSAPLFDGHTSGIKRWCDRYYVRVLMDGSYQMELETSWTYGGSHSESEMVETPIPKEWFALTYDEFVDKIITLGEAQIFGFTVEDIKKAEELKEFLGF